MARFVLDNGLSLSVQVAVRPQWYSVPAIVTNRLTATRGWRL